MNMVYLQRLDVAKFNQLFGHIVSYSTVDFVHAENKSSRELLCLYDVPT